MRTYPQGSMKLCLSSRWRRDQHVSVVWNHRGTKPVAWRMQRDPPTCSCRDGDADLEYPPLPRRPDARGDPDSVVEDPLAFTCSTCLMASQPNQRATSPQEPRTAGGKAIGRDPKIRRKTVLGNRGVLGQVFVSPGLTPPLSEARVRLANGRPRGGRPPLPEDERSRRQRERRYRWRALRRDGRRG
jgi:hypothetical protein